MKKYRVGHISLSLAKCEFLPENIAIQVDIVNWMMMMILQ